MIPSALKAGIQEKVARKGGPKLKIGLNAYSFNEPLLKGQLSLDELLEFCAEQNLEAVDLTGYYFKGYPEPPSDEVIYQVKRKAFVLGLDISGTDPYAEIAKAAPYAINWQIKENIFTGEEQVKVDLEKLFRIIRECGYRGYLPIETLGAGDPKVKVPAFLTLVRQFVSS